MSKKVDCHLPKSPDPTKATPIIALLLKTEEINGKDRSLELTFSSEYIQRNEGGYFYVIVSRDGDFY